MCVCGIICVNMQRVWHSDYDNSCCARRQRQQTPSCHCPQEDFRSVLVVLGRAKNRYENLRLLPAGGGKPAPPVFPKESCVALGFDRANKSSSVSIFCFLSLSGMALPVLEANTPRVLEAKTKRRCFIAAKTQEHRQAASPLLHTSGYTEINVSPHHHDYHTLLSTHTHPRIFVTPYTSTKKKHQEVNCESTLAYALFTHTNELPQEGNAIEGEANTYPSATIQRKLQ